ncbi:MAG: KaiC domain-containing protein, partial [Thermoplasmata archaeon]|nr:KaiC domain-containing protein [Thermoplasmata archaeon]
MTGDRVRTHIRGLDEQLQGGVPRGSVVLIAGKPGTMKSSVAFNILYRNAKENRGGAYVT